MSFTIKFEANKSNIDSYFFHILVMLIHFNNIEFMHLWCQFYAINNIDPIY